MSIATMARGVTATIQRLSTATGGFRERTWSTVETGVVMKVDELSSNEGWRYQRNGQRSTHVGFIAGSSAITQDDRIVFTYTGTTTERTMDVSGVIHYDRRYTKVYLFEESR